MSLFYRNQKVNVHWKRADMLWVGSDRGEGLHPGSFLFAVLASVVAVKATKNDISLTG